MKRRFVIILHGSLAVHQNLVTEFVKNNGYGFWHWQSGTWLVVSPFDEDAVMLRDKLLQSLQPYSSSVLVIGVDMPPDKTKNWATFGPTIWGEWFRNTWE